MKLCNVFDCVLIPSFERTIPNCLLATQHYTANVVPISETQRRVKLPTTRTHLTRNLGKSLREELAKFLASYTGKCRQTETVAL